MKVLKKSQSVSLSATSKIVTIDELQNRLKLLPDKKVVLCHGVFDLFHIGHLRHLQSAKKLGDYLVVSITDDTFVNKGPNRPVFTAKYRAEILASLEFVDFVYVNASDSAVNLIQLISPNFYVKGQEYLNDKNDFNQKFQDESQTVLKMGGKIHFTQDIVFSSSTFINRFFNQFSDEFIIWRDNFLKSFSIEDVVEFVEKISTLNIAVLGEIILDEYVFCETLGKTSKEPVLAGRILSSKIFTGGSHAVAKTCSNLGASVHLFSEIGDMDITNYEFPNLSLTLEKSLSTTITKSRLLDESTGIKLFETYKMGEPNTIQSSLNLVAKVEKISGELNGVIACDYGHGFFDDPKIKFLDNLFIFKALNVQNNAGNYGTNSIYKFKNIDFVTMNLKELRLETKRTGISLQNFITNLSETVKVGEILITKGGDGVQIITNKFEVSESPGLSANVVDRVGAGDVVLAVSSLLKMVNTPNLINAFVSNVAGSLAIGHLGNEKILDKRTLIKTIVGLLK